MRKFTLTSFTIITIVLLLFSNYSCDKMPKNGDLDGMWQFMEVSYNRNGVYDSTVNTKDYKAYMSFQLDLMSLTWLNIALDSTNDFSIISRFSKTSNQLHLYSFYKHYRSADSLIDNSSASIMSPLGIRGNDVTYDILSLNSKQMILQNNDVRITLRKF